MRILYVITGLQVGGAERITVDLAEQMMRRGNAVALMFLSGGQRIPVAGAIPVYALGMRKTPLGFFRALLKARGIVRSFKPDVVHGNMFHANFFCRILRLLCSVPRLVCTEHTKNIQGRFRMFLVWLTDCLCDVTTNVSQEAVDYFVEKKAFRKGKSLAVHNGIDLRKFYKSKNNKIREEFGIPETAFVFINVSRMMPAKDHKNLLEAFKLVHDTRSDTKLICVGAGNLLDATVAYAGDLQISDSVIFAGLRSDIPDFYNASDCFVLSSAWEGFGIVLAEAMACELPVISTDCGGTREVVQNDKWLVPPKDFKTLADKMLLLGNMLVIEREKLGKQNRELVQKFSLEEIAKKWFAIYENK